MRALFLSLGAILLLQSCGGGGGGKDGASQASPARSESCLSTHPSLQKASFSSYADAVGAFATAAADCGSSQVGAREAAIAMVKNGITIQKGESQ